MARQQKGSNRRPATKAAIARAKAREADRRRDWIEQTTTGLVRGFDLIAVEDLAVRHMVRPAKGTVEATGVNVAAKRGLDRAISAQARSMIRRRLADKTARAKRCSVAGPSGMRPTQT